MLTSVERTLLWVAAALYGAIGTLILVAPNVFYQRVPGVVASGPYNAHFLRDVGLVFATLSVAMVVALRDRRAARTATLLSAVWLCGHALLHLVAAVAAHFPASALAEAPGVYGPALVAIALAWHFNRPPFVTPT